MCFTDVSGVTSRSILFKTEGKAKKSDSIEMRLFSKYEFISLAYFFSSSELEVKSTGSMLPLFRYFSINSIKTFFGISLSEELVFNCKPMILTESGSLNFIFFI